jgi:HEAT repeat protein
VGAVVGLWASREKEPRYKGKSLSQWAEIYLKTEKPGVDHPEAAAALRAIGTNGVPTVLRWLSVKSSAVIRRQNLEIAIKKWPKPFKRISAAFMVSSDTLLDQRQRAGLVLRGLGPEAEQLAIPVLTRVLQEWKEGEAISALDALAQLEDSGFPVILATFSDPLFATNLCNFPLTVKGMPSLGTNGPRAVPLLIECLTNEEYIIRATAAECLGRVGAEPGIAVPALVRCLGDPDGMVCSYARDSLKGFGRAAVPALLGVLNDPDEETRRAAAGALGEIAPEELKKYQEAHKTPAAKQGLRTLNPGGAP